MFRVEQSLYVGAHTQSLTVGAEYLIYFIFDSFHVPLILARIVGSTEVFQIANVSERERVIVLAVSVPKVLTLKYKI